MVLILNLFKRNTSNTSNETDGRKPFEHRNGGFCPPGRRPGLGPRSPRGPRFARLARISGKARTPQATQTGGPRGVPEARFGKEGPGPRKARGTPANRPPKIHSNEGPHDSQPAAIFAPAARGKSGSLPANRAGTGGKTANSPGTEPRTLPAFHGKPPPACAAARDAPRTGSRPARRRDDSKASQAAGAG